MTGLFDGVLTRGPIGPLTDDTAWLGALLEAEAALARALADTGFLSQEHAETIVAACDPDHYDQKELGRAAADGGNPVIPLVQELTAQVRRADPEAARHVHRGATSQDIMDTAAMLLTRRAGRVVLSDLRALGRALATLAAEHRLTPMPGRTLLQQALPTTFGAVTAGWAQGVWEAADDLERALTDCSSAQLGGAVGTLASLQEHGPAVATAFAAHLDLSEPVLPWHTDRGRVVALAAAFGRACGAVGTVAHDVILLAQTEVGEVSEEAGPGVGGSSTMPHKRNPIAAVSALAAARQAPGSVATLMTTQIQEHQRAAGPWHAEWLPLTELLRRTGSAVSWMRTGIERLRVHPDRMRANLDATGGLALSERITTDLTPELGRMKAHRLVTGACAEAADSGQDLAQVLAEHLEGIRTREQMAALLDPADHLGSAPTFTDRVIAGTTGRAGTAVHHSDNEEGHDER